MDLSMAYVNGAGESVEFRADGHWHYSGGGMRSWSASFDEVGGRVASFTSGPREFEIDAVMDGALDTIIDALAAADRAEQMSSQREET